MGDTMGVIERYERIVRIPIVLADSTIIYRIMVFVYGVSFVKS